MPFEKTLDISAKVAALIAAGTSAFLSVKYSDLKEQLNVNKQELELKVSEMNRSQDSIDFDRQHRFRIYEKVYDAVETNKAEKKALAAVLVKEMLPGDQFQGSLLKIIEGNGENVKPETRELIRETIAKIDTNNRYEEERRIKINRFVALQRSDKKDFLVDVFYLESRSAALKAKAEAIQSQLGAAGFDARVRMLSDVINARSGYRVFNNQIRVEVNNDTEMKLGTEINNLAKNTFVIQPVRQSSPGYISMFLVE